MNTKKETVAEIYNLATRLENGDATFLDVARAALSRLIPVGGDQHMQEDDELREALLRLSRAIALAAERDLLQLVQKICHDIGYGVARGTLGPKFFRQIRK